MCAPSGVCTLECEHHGLCLGGTRLLEDTHRLVPALPHQCRPLILYLPVTGFRSLEGDPDGTSHTHEHLAHRHPAPADQRGSRSTFLWADARPHAGEAPGHRPVGSQTCRARAERLPALRGVSGLSGGAPRDCASFPQTRPSTRSQPTLQARSPGARGSSRADIGAGVRLGGCEENPLPSPSGPLAKPGSLRLCDSLPPGQGALSAPSLGPLHPTSLTPSPSGLPGPRASSPTSGRRRVLRGGRVTWSGLPGHLIPRSAGWQASPHLQARRGRHRWGRGGSAVLTAAHKDLVGPEVARVGPRAEGETPPGTDTEGLFGSQGGVCFRGYSQTATSL